jgi:hypothetical protein
MAGPGGINVEINVGINAILETARVRRNLEILEKIHACCEMLSNFHLH